MNTQPHLDLSKAGCPERVRMNPLGESRQEAQGRKSLLQLKSKIRIGCWNVRTLYQAGKLAQLAKEMRRYKLSIIGVCESRWNTFGKVTTSSGETYLYSGNERRCAHTWSRAAPLKGCSKKSHRMGTSLGENHHSQVYIKRSEHHHYTLLCTNQLC